jgi:heme-degrading monooxygenase HmoA
MIKLIIERKIKAGKEREAWDLLHELRSKAMRQSGYVSGETLKGYDDSSLWFAISTWLEAEDWQAWFNSPERKALEDREKALIDAPIKTTLLKFFEEPISGEEQAEQKELEAEEEAKQK